MKPLNSQDALLLYGEAGCPDRVEDPWQLADALRAEEAEFTWRYAKRPRGGRRTAPARGQARRTVRTAHD